MNKGLEFVLIISLSLSNGYFPRAYKTYSKVSFILKRKIDLTKYVLPHSVIVANYLFISFLPLINKFLKNVCTHPLLSFTVIHRLVSYNPQNHNDKRYQWPSLAIFKGLLYSFRKILLCIRPWDNGVKAVSKLTF